MSSLSHRIACGGSAVAFALLIAGVIAGAFFVVVGLSYLGAYAPAWFIAFVQALKAFTEKWAIPLALVCVVILNAQWVWKWLLSLSRPENRVLNLHTVIQPSRTNLWALAVAALSLLYFSVGLSAPVLSAATMLGVLVMIMVGIVMVTVTVWNSIDKRSLPTQSQRIVSSIVATVGAYWLIGLYMKFLLSPETPTLNLIAIGICLLFIPASLAFYYQCDENGPLARLMQRFQK